MDDNRRHRSGPTRLGAKVAVAAGLAAATALGAAVVADAASGTGPLSASTLSSSSGGSSGAESPPPSAPRSRGGRLGGLPGRILHGTFTVEGPNGATETLQLQNGTVNAITSGSGGTWSLSVTSADGTVLDYVVDSSTSVNGGENGVASISKGDTVRVLALLSDGTADATQIVDTTVLRANRHSWAPSSPGTSAPGATG
jgi:hypothetical protein